jgi:hypothetical protein
VTPPNTRSITRTAYTDISLQVVYSGPAVDACGLLGAAAAQQLPAASTAQPASPADYMLDLVIRSRREVVVSLVDAFRESE